MRDFRGYLNNINVRGDILLIDKGVSQEEAAESGYENDYGIYDMYLAEHDEEIKQFIMEAKDKDEVFTEGGEYIDKDITDWFPEDLIISLGDKEIKISRVNMHVLYEFYGGEPLDGAYQETMMSNPDPNASDYKYAQAYGVSFCFYGNELK